MSESNQAAPAAQPSAVEQLQAAMNAAETPETPEVQPEAAAPVEPEKVETPKQDDRVSSKFAALSRKEREIVQREKALKAEKAKIEQQAKEIAELKRSREEWEKELSQQLDTNPLEFLEKRGKSYKELTEKFILKEEPTPEQKQASMLEELKAEIAALRAEQKQKEQEKLQQSEEQQKKQAEQAQQNFIQSLDKHLKSNPDQYELIVKNDATQLVFDVMDSVYNSSKDPQTGESATYVRPEDFERLRDEAATEVENYLLEEAMKLTASNKIKQKLSSQVTKEPVKTPSATLSNSLSQQTPAVQERSLSEEESKRRMAAMLKYHE